MFTPCFANANVASKLYLASSKFEQAARQERQTNMQCFVEDSIVNWRPKRHKWSFSIQNEAESSIQLCQSQIVVGNRSATMAASLSLYDCLCSSYTSICSKSIAIIGKDDGAGSSVWCGIIPLGLSGCLESA